MADQQPAPSSTDAADQLRRQLAAFFGVAAGLRHDGLMPGPATAQAGW